MKSVLSSLSRYSSPASSFGARKSAFYSILSQSRKREASSSSFVVLRELHSIRLRSPFPSSLLFRPSGYAAFSSDGCTPPPSTLSLKKPFENCGVKLDESKRLRERIHSLLTDREFATTLLRSDVVFVDESRPYDEIVEEVNVDIELLKEVYSQLGVLLKVRPWLFSGQALSGIAKETQRVVGLLAVLHWRRTGTRLKHEEAQEEFEWFRLDIEDYLIGLVLTTEEMVTYVGGRLDDAEYHGDDFARRVLDFLYEIDDFLYYVTEEGRSRFYREPACITDNISRIKALLSPDT